MEEKIISTFITTKNINKRCKIYKILDIVLLKNTFPSKNLSNTKNI